MDVVSLALVALAVILIHYYLTKNYNYWEKRRIPSAPKHVPGFGHMLPVVFMKINLGELVNSFCEKFKNCSMFGYYDLRQPVLVIRDPELAKNVLLTSFSSFHENLFQVDPVLDPLVAKNPFFSSGDSWINSRKQLTYAFSSMRLRILSKSVQAVCEKFSNYLNAKLKGKDKVEFELKDLFSRFTAEVVAHAGFGVEGFCFDDKPRSDSFVALGKSMFEPSLKLGFMQLCVLFLPILGKIFRVGFIPEHIDRFFRSLVRQNLESRCIENERRNDFFQLMADMKKSEGTQLDEETLAANAMSFFLDGYETSSITLSFMAFHLAQNKHVQEKLRAEIKSVLAKHDGAITYEAVREMTYMDQVLNESQRLTPALASLAKKCTADCELKGSDGLTCHVEKGTSVLIALSDMQLNPHYWPDPNTFDPDRFSDERKSSIIKYAYLPFGEGPRICVGMRMAILQMKSCIALLLKNYELELSAKTQLPLKWNPHYFMRSPIGGLWAYIKPL